MYPQIPPVNPNPVPEILPSAASTDTPPVLPNSPQKKYKTLFFLVVILIMIIVGSTGVWAYKRFTAVTPIPSPSIAPTENDVVYPHSPEPIANWKTYSDDTRKLSFLYPEKVNGADVVITNNQKYLDVGMTPDTLFIEILSEKTTTSLTLWWKEVYKDNSKLASYSNSTFMGMADVEVTFSKSSELACKKYILIKKSDRNYSILLNHLLCNNSWEKEVEDQILSTFKFTGQNSQIDEVKSFATKYLVSKGQNATELIITDISLLGNYTDKYIVSYSPGKDYVGGGLYIVVGKVNGQWMVAEDGTSIYCDWIKNSGVDENTKLFMGPSCNFQ